MPKRKISAKPKRIADRMLAEDGGPPLARVLLHTITEAQRQLCCSRTTVYGLADQGKLDMVSIGRARRVTDSSLRSLVKRLLAEAKAAKAA
jgi:excisionase family DNA binding protein